MFNLIAEAEAFAADLSDIVNGTLSTDVTFVVTPVADADEVYVWPSGSTAPNSVELIPITSLGKAKEVLRLKVVMRMGTSSSGKHLSTQASVFALVLPGQTARPAVRIEYDRERGPIRAPVIAR